MQTFTGAMIKFFGKKEGQSNMDFGHELRKLSHEEKLEFVAMLREQPGYEDVQDPVTTKT